MLVHQNKIFSLKSDKNASQRTLKISSVRCTNEYYKEGCVKRIREMFDEVRLSAVDTAWIAMNPSTSRYPSRIQPRFPKCLRWILENQKEDGSWGNEHPVEHSRLKDSLLSTLACLLPLRKWQVGDQLLLKGFEFIAFNRWVICDPDQLSPTGNILFSKLMKHAREFDLNVSLNEDFLDGIQHNYELEMERIQENELTHFFERLGILESVSHRFDYHHNYLHSCAINKIKYWRTPIIYPSSLYARLNMVDVVQKLGLKRYFMHEIEKVLDETYRLWKQGDEEISSNVPCCALAFRHLRLGGYDDVSQDKLLEFLEQENFFNTIHTQFTGVPTIVELYKASSCIFSGEEAILIKINAWTRRYLVDHLLNQSIQDSKLSKEVEYVLRNYHGSLERVINRECIEQYKIDISQTLKTTHRCFSISTMDLVALSVRDFNTCQALHQDELHKLERWFQVNGLHHLNVPLQVLHSSFFMITADIFEPRLSETRVSFAQTCVLIRAVDDMFDNNASRAELVNIIQLVKDWNKKSGTGYLSTRVKIFFLALYNTIEELWLELLDGMMIEFDWWREGTKPNMEEYLSVACSTIGTHPCIFTGVYFIGPLLSKELIGSDEITSLCKHVSVAARLLNDLQTFEKEISERKPNSLSLLMANNAGIMTLEEARSCINKMVESSQREVLKMVSKRKGSVIPRECKSLFWTTYKISLYLYKFTNEYDFPKEILKDTQAVLFKPIQNPSDHIHCIKL